MTMSRKPAEEGFEKFMAQCAEEVERQTGKSGTERMAKFRTQCQRKWDAMSKVEKASFQSAAEPSKVKPKKPKKPAENGADLVAPENKSTGSGGGGKKSKPIKTSMISNGAGEEKRTENNLDEELFPHHTAKDEEVIANEADKAEEMRKATVDLKVEEKISGRAKKGKSTNEKRDHLSSAGAGADSKFEHDEQSASSVTGEADTMKTASKAKRGRNTAKAASEVVEQENPAENNMDTEVAVPAAKKAPAAKKGRNAKAPAVNNDEHDDAPVSPDVEAKEEEKKTAAAKPKKGRNAKKNAEEEDGAAEPEKKGRKRAAPARKGAKKAAANDDDAEDGEAEEEKPAAKKAAGRKRKAKAGEEAKDEEGGDTESPLADKGDEEEAPAAAEEVEEKKKKPAAKKGAKAGKAKAK